MLPTQVRALLIAAGVALCHTTILASESQVFVEEAKRLRLMDDPFWHALLHYRDGKSEIVDSSFFLSDFGAVDPLMELEATINAYFTPYRVMERKWGDGHITCIYPARFMWLNDKLGLPDFPNYDELCPGLRAWARLDQIDAVSLVFVSGYLGNPASSFGHVLMNFKLSDTSELLQLFDTSIAYGATVPLEENIVRYVLKGLFGGYFCTYSDKYFYDHDQVYANREFRDMWEYVLDLSDDEKRLLLYHTAELLTKRFDYYFLSDNCAQRIAVLLDLCLAEDVYDIAYPIYIPETLCHRLDDIDRKRQEDGKKRLIRNVKYIPSARRYLYSRINGLSEREVEAYKRLVRDDGLPFDSSFEDLDAGQRIRVLDALLAYQYYRLIVRGSEDSTGIGSIAFEDRIRLERLRLPPRQQDPFDIPQLGAPTDVSPPSSFEVSIVIEENRDPFPRFGLSVFNKESVGLNSLEYSEFVALALSIGVTPDTGSVFVDSFEFLRLTDFRLFNIEEAGELPFSWRLRAAVDRDWTGRDESYDAEIDGGIGLVQEFHGISGICYAFLNGSLHSSAPHARMNPSLGVVLGSDDVKVQFDYGWEWDFEHFKADAMLSTKIHYQLCREYAIQVSYEDGPLERDRVTASLVHYW